jgi:hypothetical protein
MQFGVKQMIMAIGRPDKSDSYRYPCGKHGRQQRQ